jgi:tetratricopeptide (TPR) repeat protein
MELTLEEALKKGVEEHQGGRIQEGERLYTAILRAHPKHPDANHNMGVLAVGVGKIQESLPFFKTALESNPSITQFWLSYIDALIKLDRIADANVVFYEAQDKGVSSVAFDKLKLQLTGQGLEEPSSNRLQQIINLYTDGQLEQALLEVSQMLEKFPNSAILYNIAGSSNVGLMQFDAAIENYNKAVLIKPGYAEAYNNMGSALKDKGDLEAAIESYEQAIKIKPDYAEAYNNLGVSLKFKGSLQAAIDSYSRAIKIKPNFAEAYYNKGNALQIKGNLDAAIGNYKQAVKINPDFAEAYNNMGDALQYNNLVDAIDSYKKAIKINSDYAEAHNNMGNALKDKGDPERAVESYKQAIKIKPDYAEAYNNIGTTLTKLGKLEQAEANVKQAIKLKPDFAIAHSNLGIIHYDNGDIDSALKSLIISNNIDPKSRRNGLLLSVMKGRKARKKAEVSMGDISKPICGLGLATNPLILNRVVEKALTTKLYEMDFMELNRTKDARYGNGRCSPSFNLFEDDQPLITNVADDLIRIIMEAVKSDIYVFDSFFNIIGAGGGSNPHNHLTDLDEDHRLNLANQKYSLVYYLSVGEQCCSEPGILKLYDPSEDILPCEGMIVIIPAGRNHSAVYGGNKDRLMIGVNFYLI